MASDPTIVIETLTIVGVGLIGGSIGLGAKRHGLADRIVGAGRNTSTLDRARTLGAIDEVATDYLEAVREANVVVFCTPVDRIVGRVSSYRSGDGAWRVPPAEARRGRCNAAICRASTALVRIAMRLHPEVARHVAGGCLHVGSWLKSLRRAGRR